MWERIYCLIHDYFYPPPVTWDELARLGGSIDLIDRDIELIRIDQLRTRDVYMFASMEHQIQYLINRRVKLSVQRQELLNRARKQGPRIDCDLYCKFL